MTSALRSRGLCLRRFRGVAWGTTQGGTPWTALPSLSALTEQEASFQDNFGYREGSNAPHQCGAQTAQHPLAAPALVLSRILVPASATVAGDALRGVMWRCGRWSLEKQSLQNGAVGAATWTPGRKKAGVPRGMSSLEIGVQPQEQTLAEEESHGQRIEGDLPFPPPAEAEGELSVPNAQGDGEGRGTSVELGGESIPPGQESEQRSGKDTGEELQQQQEPEQGQRQVLESSETVVRGRKGGAKEKRKTSKGGQGQRQKKQLGGSREHITQLRKSDHTDGQRAEADSGTVAALEACMGRVRSALEGQAQAQARGGKEMPSVSAAVALLKQEWERECAGGRRRTSAGQAQSARGAMAPLRSSHILHTLMGWQARLKQQLLAMAQDATLLEAVVRWAEERQGPATGPGALGSAASGFPSDKRLVAILEAQQASSRNPHETATCVAMMELIHSHQKSEALALYRALKSRLKGRVSVHTANMALLSHIKVNEIEQAQTLFQSMQEKGPAPNHLSYSMMLQALGDHRQLEASVAVFKQLQAQGLVPDAEAWQSMVQMHAAKNDVAGARAWFRDMLRAGCAPTKPALMALLRMYRGQGMVQEAGKVEQVLAGNWMSSNPEEEEEDSREVGTVKR